MSFILVLVCLFVLSDVLWWIASYRRSRARWFRIVVSLFAAMQLVGLLVIMGARRLNPEWVEALPRPVISVVFIWHLLISLPWLIIYLCSGLVRGVRVLVVRRHLQPHLGGEGMSRREWMRASVTMAPVVLTAGGALAAEWQLEHFQVRRMTLPITALPPALDGLTLAHVSDLHVGHFTRGAVLEQIVRTTNDLNADFVMMTGDLINMTLRDLPAAIDVMRGMHGRHGVFLCEGNHDLFENPEGFRRGVRDSGLPILLGESAKVNVRGTTIQVLGSGWAHDDRGHAAGMMKLKELRDPNAFPIVLVHHPHAFDFAEGFPLTLAGHTHGGQLMLTKDVGFGPWIFRYWSGEYRREGRTLVVSNGAGNWFPLRINAPAEIVHLTLRAAG